MVDLLKKYIENRIQLIKLDLIAVFANMASGLVSVFIILVFSLFILLMLSFSLAFWLSQELESFAIGFMIVGGIYALIFIIYLLVSKKNIDAKIKDSIVKSALSSNDELDQE